MQRTTSIILVFLFLMGGFVVYVPMGVIGDHGEIVYTKVFSASDEGHDIHWQDAAVGNGVICIMGDNVGTSPTQREAIRSIDGGMTWENVTGNLITATSIITVAYDDHHDVFWVQGDTREPNHIWYGKDCKNWQVVSYPTWSSSHTFTRSGIAGKDGVIISTMGGVDGVDGGTLHWMRSTDKGESWTKHSQSGIGGGATLDDRLDGRPFTDWGDEDVWLIWGCSTCGASRSRAITWYSDDRGLSWDNEVHWSSTSGDSIDDLARNETHIWAVGIRNGVDDNSRASTDGQNWFSTGSTFPSGDHCSARIAAGISEWVAICRSGSDDGALHHHKLEFGIDYTADPSYPGEQRGFVIYAEDTYIVGTTGGSDQRGNIYMTGDLVMPPTVNITDAPSTVASTQIFDVTAQVTNDTGVPLEGRTVTLTSDPAEIDETGITDEEGKVTFTVSLTAVQTHTVTATDEGGGSDSVEITVTGPLPPGWAGPIEGNPEAPVLNYPEGKNPAGVSFSTHRTTHSWILATGFQSEVQGEIQVHHSRDRFQSSRTTVLDQRTGESEIGGLSWNTDSIRGCFTHGTNNRAGVSGFSDIGDQNQWSLYPHWSRNIDIVGYCDTGQIRDRPSRELVDNALVFDMNDQFAALMYPSTASDFALAPVSLPSGGQVGVDAISFIPRDTGDGISRSARLAVCSTGSIDTPLAHTGVHLTRAWDFARQGGVGAQRFIHDTLASSHQSETVFQACDVAVSNPQSLLVAYHDPNRNQVRIASGGFTNHLDTHPAFTENQIVTHLRITTAGQGNYVGVYTTDQGVVVAFSTKDNGFSWERTILSDDLITVQDHSQNHFKADVGYDHEEDLFIVVWTGTGGIRMAHTEFIPSIRSLDADRSTSIERLDRSRGAFEEKETWVGVNLADQGESTGMGETGVKLLMAALIGFVIIFIVYIVTRRFDMAISGGGGISIIATAYWGLIPFWVFLITILLSAGFFVRGAMQK